MFLIFLLTLTLISESRSLTVVSEACARWAIIDTRVDTCNKYTCLVTDVNSQSFLQVPDVPCTCLTVCQEPRTIIVTPSALVNRWKYLPENISEHKNIWCRWARRTAVVARAARPSAGWCSDQSAPRIRSWSTPISARLSVLVWRTL